MLLIIVAMSLISLAFATKLVITTTRPTSNSTGNSFTIIPVRDGVVGSRSQQSFESYSSSVDDKVAELRSAGQSSPTGLTFLQIGLSNPDFGSNEILYQALINTGSAFNVVNLLVMEQLAMPLGSECKIRWGGKEESEEVGRFSVLRVNIAEERKDMIFCYIPNAFATILNQEFLTLWGFCIGGNNSVRKCSESCRAEL